MRSSFLKLGLRVAASGLVVAGLGMILAGVASVEASPTALQVVGGVVVAAGLLILAHGPGIVGWLGPERREDGTLGTPTKALRRALYAGGIGFVVLAIGSFVGAIDTSGTGGSLTVAANVVIGIGDLVIFYAVVSVAVFVVGGGLGDQVSGWQAGLRVGLSLAALGFLVSMVGSLLIAVGFANSIKSIVITADMLDAAGTALVFAGVMVGALGGVSTGPPGVLLMERLSLRVGLLVGAFGFLSQAIGSLLVGLSLVGSGSTGVFIAGDVVQGAGLWVTAIGVAVIASLGVESRGPALAAPAAGSPTPPWSYDPSPTPRQYEGFR